MPLFRERLNSQMAAVILPVILSFYAIFPQNSLFFCKYVRKIYCEQRILHCQPRCRIVLFSQFRSSHFFAGNVKELLQKLDPFCSTYHYVDCLYTLSKYQFNGNIVGKSYQVFDYVKKTVYYNQRDKGIDRMPSIAKKFSWGRRIKSILELIPKNKINAKQWISLCRKN